MKNPNLHDWHTANDLIEYKNQKQRRQNFYIIIFSLMLALTLYLLGLRVIDVPHEPIPLQETCYQYYTKECLTQEQQDVLQKEKQDYSLLLDQEQRRLHDLLQ